MAGETWLGGMVFLSSLVLGATAVVLPRCISPVAAAAQADSRCDIVYHFLASDCSAEITARHMSNKSRVPSMEYCLLIAEMPRRRSRNLTRSRQTPNM